MTIHWEPGTTVVLRGIWRNNIWWAIPVIVVQDAPELIALYLRAGTPNKTNSRRVTPQDLLSEQSLPLVDSQWVKTDVLMLVPPAASHTVNVMWETGQSRFLCWYVNLQAPLIRNAIGFDTTDYMLDVVIQPDCSTWRWKDEEEFEVAVSIGVYSTEQAQAIRAEGMAVIQKMKAGLSPFCDGWERWSQPAEWPIPQFPPGWEKI